MKTEKNRNLKGTVLFTVVSVLSIMIIFMTCTLAMAAAANKRARKTYSSAQSSYTARTTIDGILAAIGTDKDFSKAVRSLDEGKEMDIVVNVNNPSLGTITNAKIKNAGKKNVFDPSDDKMTWITCNVYEISADVTIGGETTTIKSNILQDAPGGGGGGGGGAAFLTWGDATVGNHSAAWGGTYFGMGAWGNKNWQNDLEYIKYSNDDFNLVTTLSEKKYLTNENYKLDKKNAFETPVVINGNANPENFASFYYTFNSSGIDNPGVQVWGDINFGNDNTRFYVDSALANYLNSATLDFNQVPYLYVDGKIVFRNNCTLKLTEKGKDVIFPFNVFCGSFNCESNNANINADIYCMDEDDTSVFQTTGSKLMKWSKSVVNGGKSYSSVGGNFYSKGSVKIKGGELVVDGDMIVEGDLTVDSSLKVNGDLVVAGVVNGKTPEVGSGKKFYRNGTRIKAGYEKVTKNMSGLEALAFEASSEGNVLAKDVRYVYQYDWINANEMLNNNGAYKACKYAIISSAAITDPKLAGRFSKVNDGGVEVYDFSNRYMNTYSKDPNQITDYFVKGYDVNEFNNNIKGKTVQVDYYKVAGVNPEKIVSSKEATEAGPEEGVPSIELYKSMHGGECYPERAERETLLGIYWSVKGIEGRVVKEVPAEHKSAVASKVLDNIQAKSQTITSSCTLTGTFDSTVNVVAGNSDIYIKLHNVNFKSPMISDGAGGEKPSNSAKISVKENGNGRVYFVLEGTVNSNYDYSTERQEEKLIKTVYDWQKEFDLENNLKTPSGTAVEYKKADDLPQVIIDGKKYRCIADNAVLTGSWGDSTEIVVIPKSPGEVWVTLDNFVASNSTHFIVEDCELESDGKEGGIPKYKHKVVNGEYVQLDNQTTEVDFYVKGKCQFWGTSAEQWGGIASRFILDYVDKGKKFNIVSRPNDPIISEAVLENKLPVLKSLITRIYSEVPAKGQPNTANVETHNHIWFHAYINAIFMDMQMPTAYENGAVKNAIIYDGQPLETAENQDNRIGVIGLLNCGSLNKGGGDNDWTMLYVDEGGGSIRKKVVDAEGAHAYEAVEYMAFAK